MNLLRKSIKYIYLEGLYSKEEVVVWMSIKPFLSYEYISEYKLLMISLLSLMIFNVRDVSNIR